MTSAAQDRWVEIAEALREILAKRLQDVLAMEPGDITILIGSLEDAYCFHVDTLRFDENVETGGRGPGEQCASK